MANRIKGITVEIGGDTTKLDKALAGTNKELKTTQDNLRDVDRLLKIDPKNTVLLEQKQKLLAEAVEGTKKKLDTLKDAAAQAGDALKKGTINSSQYDALQREIIETEKSLASLEKKAKDLKVHSGNLGKALDTVADKAGKVAEKTKMLSTVAGGAIAGLAGLAIEAGKTADDLNTLSKQTGFSTEEIQKWKYASELIDVSVDDIVSAARRMKKNMDSTSADVVAAWEALGIAVRDSRGEFRSSDDVFYELLFKLSKIPNETERDILAMQLFGKSADQLAGIVDDGGDALKKLGEEAKNAGLILGQDALDNANKFNDGIDELKAKAKAAFSEVGAEIAESLLPMMEKLVDHISDFLMWISRLSDGQIKAIASIALIVAAIGPLSAAIANIITIVQTLRSTMSLANVQVGVAVAAFSVLAALLIKVIDVWDDMTGFEKFIAVLGLIAAAALTAAVAVGAFQSALTTGIAVAGIVAGIAAVAVAVSSAQKRAEQEAKRMQRINNIPHLADGAVLHPNQPFLAMVGDQKRGTNIEAPMDTIKQGGREVMGERGGTGVPNVNIRFSGSLSQLARALKPEIEIESARSGSTARR